MKKPIEGTPSELSPKEAALVTTNNMTDLELMIPSNVDPDAEIPKLVIFLSAMMVRASDPDFVKEQIDWFFKQTRS